LKITSLSLPAAAASVLGLALFAVTTVAQAPPPPGGDHPHPPAPAPTNPKTLTGDQVHEIMHGWAKALGTQCDTCHTADPVKKMPNGQPALNFADDSKKEKETARAMVKMTMDINQNYTSKVESSKNNAPEAKMVGCGTCHRGQVDPPAWVPPPDQHEHHEGAPPTAPH
jgi:Photosynthetic reaction centre cytochrome C subunit